MNKLYKIGGSILGIGIIIFIISFCLSGFDIKKLETQQSYKRNTIELSTKVDSITIEDNVNVIFNKSNDNKIHIEYYDNDKEYYKINKGNNLNITKIVEYKWYDYFFNINFENLKLYIQVPDSFKGNIKIKNSNNKIELKNIAPNNLDISSSNGSINLFSINVSNNIKAKTSNGSIKLDSINSKDIVATTSNGKIELLNINANNSIFADSSNGKINLSYVNVEKELNLHTSNGSISGSIYGKQQDFSITSSSSNGKSNLPQSYSSGDKILYARTSNGKIDIDFINVNQEI